MYVNTIHTYNFIVESSQSINFELVVMMFQTFIIINGIILNKTSTLEILHNNGEFITLYPRTSP